MNTYTISLSNAQNKALSYIAVSPQEWIENVVHERCRIAIEEIFQAEVTRMTADPEITEIPADKELVVMNAEILTAAERLAQREIAE